MDFELNRHYFDTFTTYEGAKAHMKIQTLSKKELSKFSNATQVVFAAQDDKDSKKLRFEADSETLRALIEDVHKVEKFKGVAKDCVFFRNAHTGDAKHVLLVGLGKSKHIDLQALRVAGSVVAKALAREKVEQAYFGLKALAKFHSKIEELGEALAEGAGLGAYKFEEFKSKKDDKKEEGKKKATSPELFAVVDDKSSGARFLKGVHVGSVLAEATNFARDLGNRPGNTLTPTALADYAKEAAKGLPIKFTAWGKKEIEKHKMGCLLAVNRGSEEEPRFIVMEYHGGKKSEKPFVLVGKGLTFDSGGISLKPGAGMEEMKFDMCGGAAVIASIVALAKLKAKVNVVVVVPSTENMPSGRAIKPGDIAVASNGKTVEINNTDAEGRLILADALVYACGLKPRAIVDAATLTGACVMALGNVFTGFFSKDEKFVKVIKEAASHAGEKIWQLPLTEEYVEDMKGTYADLCNIGGAKGGGASQGAAFLSQFVDEGITWAHFDIAGTAWNCGSRSALNPDKGGTGVMVRTFVKLAQS